MFLNIDWNNINWDLASTLSSSFLSIVAIIISVVAVVKTSKDNNRILEENSRAYISIYTEALIANRNHFYIVIKNFGNTNAHIESIEVDNKTREMIKLGNKDYIDRIVNNQLAPKQSITHLVSKHKNDFDSNHISKFKITYTSGRKIYSDIFEFNLSWNSTMPSISISTADYDKQFLELYQDEVRKKL
ncbi:hypothetical protein [Jeotgalibaca caeni]|uniref:hypothetical protein n=1 Tax=Jeotgalibaca caeni TaxID=3028623 RepID=UPI00237E3E35|nr:hypothetical protein [Jeotgalibaca caeni]MDE1549485.1 hypothetical protein [Jeotgalibaca caeni]